MDYYYTLDEELAAVLWEDIPFINSNNNDDNNNNNNDNHNNDNLLFANRVDCNSNGMAYEHGYGLNDNHREHQQQSNQATVINSVGKQKRKREAHQIQHHIIAERKRRQLLTQRFIALSAIVPGLKKMDKTSILGEAIKYLKQLQEKVKTLEEEQTTKRTIESTSITVIKNSNLLVDNVNNDINGVDDNDSSSLCSVADNNGNISDNNASYPEIEVKVSGETLLLKFHCEKQSGILVKLFAEIERNDLRVDSCCIIPFGSLALDVTIVVQMEKGWVKNVKEIVKALHSALRY